LERAQAGQTRARQRPAVKRVCGGFPARRLGLCGAAALVGALLPLSLAGSASAAASPTGDAGASIATAPAGAVAGSVDAGGSGVYISHTCGVRTSGTIACWGSNAFGQATPPGGTFTAVSAGNQHTWRALTGTRNALPNPGPDRP
jgi:Regulator of Chromosome Condensation (RCC1) repeat protein